MIGNRGSGGASEFDSISPLNVVADSQVQQVGLRTAEYDFGEVCLLDRSVVTKTFRLQNVRDTPITISHLRPGCHCITAKFVSQNPKTSHINNGLEGVTVVPSGTIDVLVSVDLTQVKSGRVHKTIFVYLKGHDKPDFYLRVNGGASSGVSFTPRILDFARVVDDEKKTITFTENLDRRLTFNGNFPKIVSSNPFVEVTDVPASQNIQSDGALQKSYNVTLLPGGPYGILTGRLYLRPADAVRGVKNPKEEQWRSLITRIDARLSMTGRVAGPVACKPLACILGTIKPGETSLQKLTLTADSTELSALSITSESQWITAKIVPDPMGPDGHRDVEVTVSKDAPKGLLKSHLKIVLKNGRYIAVPVVGLVN